MLVPWRTTTVACHCADPKASRALLLPGLPDRSSDPRAAGTAASRLLLQHRHMQASADFHALAPIERDRRRVVREDVQKRNLAPRDNLSGDRAKQDLRVAAAAVCRVNADGRHLGVLRGLHPFARHGDELSIDTDAKE